MNETRLEQIRKLYFEASVRMSPDRAQALLTATRDLLKMVDDLAAEADGEVDRMKEAFARE